MNPDGICFSLTFMGQKTSIIVNGRTQFKFVQIYVEMKVCCIRNLANAN